MRLLASVVAVALLLGVVTGALWEAWAPRAVLQVQSGGAYLVSDAPRQFISADLLLGVLLTVAGLLLGGYAAWAAGRVPLVGVVLTPVAAALTGVVARWVGQWLGRVDPASLAHDKVGLVIRAPLQLGAWVVVLACPVAALVVWLVADALRPDPGVPAPARGAWPLATAPALPLPSSVRVLPGPGAVGPDPGENRAVELVGDPSPEPAPDPPRDPAGGQGGSTGQ